MTPTWLALLAIAMLGCSGTSAAGQVQLQPLGADYAGCGCSLAPGKLLESNDPLLFQELQDPAPDAVIRIGDRIVPLQPVAGILQADWGQDVGTPVHAEFADRQYRVVFDGAVALTCYETESCEAIWIDGTLSLSTPTTQSRQRVSGACGC